MPPFHSRSTGAREDRPDELVRRQPVGLDAERLARLRGDRDRLRACAATRRRPRRSAPGRSRPTRSAAARTGAAARRSEAAGSGSGSRKTWRWSNAASSRMCGDSSMPLPNTSPDMSPMPTTVKSVRLDVGPELAEVALDRLPRAARRDAHLLVVVARRAAGGERVAEPEAVLGGDRRWRGRRTSPCPCRRRRRGRGRRRRGARRAAAARSRRRRCCR